jgi:hypothetical protein
MHCTWVVFGGENGPSDVCFQKLVALLSNTALQCIVLNEQSNSFLCPRKTSLAIFVKHEMYYQKVACV